jgi:Ca-activated chloride channel family protein
VLAALLLPLLVLCFRRGWIAVWALVMLTPLPRAHAFEWQDLWQRPDQRGAAALEAEQPERAAELFDNPVWRGTAQYRAGRFEDSAASLSNVDSALGHYNRGNALAKAGQLPAAIAAYDRALELDPNHEDARFNRDLLQQYLEDHPEQQQNQSDGQQSQQGDSNGDQSQSGEQQEGSDASEEGDSEQGDQSESSQSQSADGQDQPDDAEGEPDGEESEEQNANAGEQAAEESVADASGTEDVEQWASEQAAEQWLRRVPQDPGGLLRRKFLYQYQRLGVDQNGNRITESAPAERRPW